MFQQHNTFSSSQFCIDSDEKSKPPSEPAPLPKENPNIINEDDAPWRRPTNIRTRPQPENPSKYPRKSAEVSLELHSSILILF